VPNFHHFEVEKFHLTVRRASHWTSELHLFLGIEGLNIYPNTMIHHVINKYRCYNLCWSIAPSLVSGDDGCIQQPAIGLSLGNPNFQWLWVNNSW
jgi:hypothetical protein